MADSTTFKKLSFTDLTDREASEIRGGESITPIKGDPAVVPPDPGVTTVS